MEGVNFAMEDFDVRLGWYPIGDALAIIGPVAGPSAWQEMKLAIRHKRLPVRCLADGVTRDFEPHWLDFSAWDEPLSDTLWFDKEKAWRKGVSVPNRAERIVVEAAHLDGLWPGTSAKAMSERAHEGLYDLIAWTSARHGLPREQLLVRAFRAIVTNELPATAGTIGLDQRLPPGPTLREVITGAITAIERDPHFFAYWFKEIVVRRSDFDQWLLQNRVPLVENDPTPGGDDPAPPVPRKPLSPAPVREIRRALTDEYDEAETEGRKPPNVKEVVGPVKERLRENGYEASGRRISDLAGEEEYKSRRRKPGPTLASEKRQQRRELSR
jgi:hypothetical protein